MTGSSKLSVMGRDGDDIFRTWTSNDFAELQRLQGEGVRGEWTLRVVDKASQDVGRLLHWRLSRGGESEWFTVVPFR